MGGVRCQPILGASFDFDFFRAPLPRTPHDVAENTVGYSTCRGTARLLCFGSIVATHIVVCYQNTSLLCVQKHHPLVGVSTTPRRVE